MVSEGMDAPADMHYRV